MRKVGAFTKDQELNRRLVEFESNADTAIRSLEGRALKKRVVSAATAAKPGDLIVIRGNSAFTIGLAAPTETDETREIWLIKTNAVATITIAPVGTLVNGANSVTMNAIGVRRLVIAEGAYWY